MEEKIAEHKSADLDLTLQIGKDFFLRNKCFPTSLKNDCLHVSVPLFDELLLEALTLRTSLSVHFDVVPEQIINTELKIIAGDTSVSVTSNPLADLLKSEIELREDSSIEEIREKSQSEPVVKLVNEIVDQAISESATDIHIEPFDQFVKVRYRKDGMLRDSAELPKWVQAPLVSRLKILASLDIAEKRRPHDGRIKWIYNGEAIDMRVSTLPTRLGEKVVMRVLKHAFYVSDLDSLGMPSNILNAIKQIVHMPQGMFFVTGPTGSGKTSTLYAGLREIIHKDINISTIEDPIEYRMDGANQVQVNEKAGLTFAGALRSLLRQDPDVMLVGEIRDEETAAIAVQAAQTGHLVFSTLHTNDSVSAVSRMIDLKVKPFLISSSVLGILAQRLVRKVCPHCKAMQPPSEETRKLLPDLPDICPKAKGCNKCNFTGYAGRTGIFELLEFNNDIKNAILDGNSEQQIKQRANYQLMLNNGLQKIKQGILTPEELLRVAVTER